jgi:tetratricopeptide (TPR) repeat protein
MENSPSERTSLADAVREIERLTAQVEELSVQASESSGRVQRWLTAAGTVSVTLLAFLVPSIQEQWDRMRQKAALDDYHDVASALMRDHHYHEAEQLLERAIDASSEPRPDLDRERLLAKTERVNADAAWDGKITEELTEEDFVLLEAMLDHAHDTRKLSWTCNNHAVFLASQGQRQRALALARRALSLQPSDARLYVTVGNVLWDQGQLGAARKSYEDALARDADNLRAHYDLGLLLESLGDAAGAGREWQRVLALDPNDPARDDLERVTAAANMGEQRTRPRHSS